MFHYTNQNTALSSRRLTSGDRPASDNDAYFQQYSGGVGAAGRHTRGASDFSYASRPTLRPAYPMVEEEEEKEDQEPMDILYESQVRGHPRHRHHSEPVNMGSETKLELQISLAADHLLSLLQREASDYSIPLPVRYYPTEFLEADDIKEGQKKTTIGPWRKRIASWMYDVVDHFQYDRNVVSVALRYIDQYVGHLLMESQRAHRRMDSGITSARGDGSISPSGQPIKRRHFQLIAVTSLYLAIKVHGELMEDDPTSGDAYDVVASLVHEVDGRLFLGKPLLPKNADEDEDVESEESDDDLRVVHHKITDLKRRQRKGRWSMQRLSQLGLPLVHPSSSTPSGNSNPAPKRAHSNLPYKPRKRGMLSGPLRLHSFVELSRGLFTAKDITGTERKILLALNYVVNPPTSRRFAGELVRLLALTYCATVDGRSANAEATAAAAERMLGLERKEILGEVLRMSCEQIEGSASVPSLSIGCLPSVVAYGAVMNAVEEVFDGIAASGSDGPGGKMEMEMSTAASSPQLEDFQRHYRRYSRNTSPSPSAPPNSLETDRELFLEAWKDQFLATVYHATNCFLNPESQDILRVRELLLDHIKDGEETAAGSGTPSSAASPTEAAKSLQDGQKKRSPRSPRSVAIAVPNPRMLRGNSFFSRQGTSFSRASSAASSSVRLLSPYDSRGRTTSASSIGGSSVENDKGASFRSLSASTNNRRAYYKQTSEPVPEQDPVVAAGRFSRAQTPDVSHFRQRGGSNYEGGWNRVQSSTGEAFQPPNPNPFFSA